MDIGLYTIVKAGPAGEETIDVALLRGKRVQLALPVTIKGRKIHFPAIINSRLFNPNGPRNRVLLTGVADKEIEENRSLMLEAVELYQRFIGANSSDSMPVARSGSYKREREGVYRGE